MHKEENWGSYFRYSDLRMTPKEAAFRQRPEGSEDQAMKKSIPDKGKCKQKGWEVGRDSVHTYLKNIQESSI